jgi:hypothetical protein
VASLLAQLGRLHSLATGLRKTFQWVIRIGHVRLHQRKHPCKLSSKKILCHSFFAVSAYIHEARCPTYKRASTHSVHTPFLQYHTRSDRLFDALTFKLPLRKWTHSHLLTPPPPLTRLTTLLKSPHARTSTIIQATIPIIASSLECFLYDHPVCASQCQWPI